MVLSELNVGERFRYLKGLSSYEIFNKTDSSVSYSHVKTGVIYSLKSTSSAYNADVVLITDEPKGFVLNTPNVSIKRELSKSSTTDKEFIDYLRQRYLDLNSKYNKLLQHFEMLKSKYKFIPKN